MIHVLSFSFVCDSLRYRLRNEQAEDAANSWQASTQGILKEMNEYQGRVQEKQRLRTAQRSEIRMYDELLAAAKKKVADLEHDIVLRKQLSIAGDAKVIRAKSLEAPTPTKRPTAYLPLEEDDDTIQVPRPVRQTTFQSI